MRVFFIYTGCLALFLILCLTADNVLNSYPLYLVFYRTFNILEYGLLSIFFALIIKKGKLNKFLILSIAFYVLFSIYDYIRLEKTSFTYYPQLTECIIFLFIIVYIFYEKMNTDLSTPIYQLPIFWILFAFLIYFSGNFFLFLYFKSSVKDENFKMLYHVIYGTVTITKNLLLCIGIYQVKYITTPITSSDQIANLDLDPFNPTDKLKKV